MFLQIGLILNLKLFKTTPVTKYFEDQFYWEVSFNVKLTVWEYIYSTLLTSMKNFRYLNLKQKVANSISRNILDTPFEMHKLFPRLIQSLNITNVCRVQRGLSALLVGLNLGLNLKWWCLLKHSFRCSDTLWACQPWPPGFVRSP